MKENLLLAIACLFAGFLQAQDTLYRVDGTRQIVKIIEVNPAQVRYVPFSDPESPIYVLSKQAVARIIYENGTVDSFQAIREPGDTPAVILYEEPFYRNILSIYVVDILLGTFKVSYEHLTRSGKWGLKIPVSLGFLKLPYDIYYVRGRHRYYDEIFSLSPALNFYPFGQERITYYAGLSFLYGRHRYYYDDYGYIIEFKKDAIGSISGYALNNGFFFPLSDNLVFSAQFVIGREFKRSEARDRQKVRADKFMVPVEINICYKF